MNKIEHLKSAIKENNRIIRATPKGSYEHNSAKDRNMRIKIELEYMK